MSGPLPFDGAAAISSDVFDTALVRAVGRPADAFLLLGCRLRRLGLWKASPRDLLVHRARAEVDARALHPGNEPALEAIYELLARCPALVDPKAAMAEELAVERHLLTPERGHAELLRAARRDGLPVWFVSDTYLSSSFLREVLADVAGPADRILASCEEGASKRTGQLLGRLPELIGAAATSIVHMGDDPVADVAMARDAGLRVHRVAHPELTRYERALLAHTIATDGAASLLAGSGRIVRTQHDTRLDAARLRVATGVAAPLLVGFVAWVLRTARAAGCEDVCFVSRDGQLLHAVAERLEARRAPEDRVTLHYIHGGRRAWHPSGLTEEVLDGPPPAWFLGEGVPDVEGPPRWQAPLDLLAIPVEQVPRDVVGALRAAARRGAAARRRALTDLWSHPSLRALLADVAEQRRDLLVRYLDERSLGQRRWAVVDLGWRGRSAASLNRALRSAGRRTPLYLYAGLIKPESELTATGDWATYLFTRPGPDAGPTAWNGGLPSFLEVLCTADHGPVRGFEVSESQVNPVLDPTDERIEAWGRADVQAAILAVVDRVAPFALDLEHVDLRPAVADVVTRFLDDPDLDEVRAWGSFPYAVDAAGEVVTPWVSPWSLRQLLSWALRGNQPRSFWPQASMALAPRMGRSLVGLRRWVSSRRRAG